MPALADRLAEEFALAAVAFNGNIRAAYVHASGCDPSYPKIPSLSRVLSNRPDIAFRIREIMEASSGQEQFTKDMHLETLATIRDTALAAGNHHAALMAEVKRGEAVNFYKVTAESTVNHRYQINMPPPVASIEDWAKSANVPIKVLPPPIDVAHERVPA